MWCLARQRAVTRAHVYGGGTTTFELVPIPEYGTFTTRVAAKRAYVASLVPSLADADDSFITRWFSKEPMRLHGVRVIKVTPQSHVARSSCQL